MSTVSISDAICQDEQGRWKKAIEAIYKRGIPMNPESNTLLNQALSLPRMERAELIDRLVESLGSADRPEIDALWAVEVERRIDAYRKGDLESVPLKEVFREIDARR